MSNASGIAVRAYSTRFEQAGDAYSAVVCDHCERAVGEHGHVRLSQRWPGEQTRPWLDGALCEECAADGRSL